MNALNLAVFPARAGMSPTAKAPGPSPRGFPRASGDEPFVAQKITEN